MTFSTHYGRWNLLLPYVLPFLHGFVVPSIARSSGFRLHSVKVRHCLLLLRDAAAVPHVLLWDVITPAPYSRSAATCRTPYAFGRVPRRHGRTVLDSLRGRSGTARFNAYAPPNTGWLCHLGDVPLWRSATFCVLTLHATCCGYRFLYHLRRGGTFWTASCRIPCGAAVLRCYSARVCTPFFFVRRNAASRRWFPAGGALFALRLNLAFPSTVDISAAACLLSKRRACAFIPSCCSQLRGCWRVLRFAGVRPVSEPVERLLCSPANASGAVRRIFLAFATLRLSRLRLNYRLPRMLPRRCFCHSGSDEPLTLPSAETGATGRDGVRCCSYLDLCWLKLDCIWDAVCATLRWADGCCPSILPRCVDCITLDYYLAFVSA